MSKGDGDVEFLDLPAQQFPFDVLAYPEESTADEEVVWSRHVAGPGVLHIPSVAETGRRVRLVVRYADGTVDR